MTESLLLVACVALCGYSVYRLWPLPAGEGAAQVDPYAQVTDEPRQSAIELFLRRLSVGLPSTALLAMLLMGALLSGLLALEFFPGRFGLALICGFGMAALGMMALADLASWRTRQFEIRLQDAIDLMNTGLEGGLSPRQSLQAAADAAESEVREELQNILDRLDLGLPAEQAIRRLRTGYDSEGVRLFTQSIVAKWHDAGDFARLLQAVGDLIRDRVKLRKLVEGQLSGTRYAAIFSGILPYALVPVFLWRQPEWLEALTTHPHGPSFLAGALLLQAVGFIWLRKILRVEL